MAKFLKKFPPHLVILKSTGRLTDGLSRFRLPLATINVQKEIFVPHLSTCRMFSSLKKLSSTDSSFSITADSFSTQAKEDDRGVLVYQGRVGHLFRALKLFSLTTSGIGLSLQPYLIMTYQDMPLSAAIPFFGAINGFIFMNPILIHFVAKKYISELYFNPETKVFTAILFTFFARRMKFTFTAEDVQVPDVPGMFAMFTAKGRPLFAHEGDFTSLQVYKHLMGFDRPLNITYDVSETNDKKQD